MNSDLHHKWNAERDGTRCSGNSGEQVLQKNVDLNKITLKKVGPQQGKHTGK